MLRQHAGTALYVRPVAWTDLHTKLLGARFRELPPCDAPVPANRPGSAPSRGHMWPSGTILSLSEALTQIILPSPGLVPFSSPGSRAVHSVLSILWPGPFQQPNRRFLLHLFVGDRLYRNAVRTPMLWDYPAAGSSCPSSSSSGPHADPRLRHRPMMCYVDREQLTAMRQQLWYTPPAPHGSPNLPVSRLHRVRSRALMPANPDLDVQIVAMFLAMAQKHFYPEPRDDAPEPNESWCPPDADPPALDFHDLKLRILSRDSRTAEFILYTGYVTAKFLERFHNPREAPLDEDGNVPGLRIEYARVPIWPILGLRERLGRALGEDIVGPFDPTEMETWEFDKGEERAAQGSDKRKREAPLPTLDKSFEDASDGERPGHASGKRRRVGTTRVLRLAV
ncbi:hypothetical protein CDD83_2238 [Cordyceps sp. RAO-2017]|nr:hypothetical protein CDD83_2238 [Cordyceps sp. RAO-2017]